VLNSDHTTTALRQLDCPNVWSQQNTTTQPAGQCTSMISELQHTDSWTVHISDHSTTAISQLVCENLWLQNSAMFIMRIYFHSSKALTQVNYEQNWSQHHSTQLDGLCRPMITKHSHLDGAHLWSQKHSTQSAGLCKSMITALQHSASWNITIFDQSITVFRQLGFAHLRSKLSDRLIPHI